MYHYEAVAYFQSVDKLGKLPAITICLPPFLCTLANFSIVYGPEIFSQILIPCSWSCLEGEQYDKNY
jgi:hypothetical protein